ncbi:hypothetical protein DWB63_02325 [Pseudodesulfovibrio sp. S3]|nr:hypothetical protein DWB63_02325 [Pseudodesulfovibrio sp. S3]
MMLWKSAPPGLAHIHALHQQRCPFRVQGFGAQHCDGSRGFAEHGVVAPAGQQKIDRLQGAARVSGGDSARLARHGGPVEEFGHLSRPEGEKQGAFQRFQCVGTGFGRDDPDRGFV